MKTKASKIILAVCIVVVLVIAAVILLIVFKGNSKEDNADSISYVDGLFIIDYDDLREVAGSNDYIFVGQVISEGKTEDDEELPLPVTEFKIRVEENIKGELITDEDITIYKSGGISDETGMLTLYEDDCMPEAGNRYVFYAFAQPDGTLLLSGPVSNVLIGSADTQGANASDDYSENQEYLAALDAYENEIESDIVEPLTCEYDVEVYDKG
ncbi:MAG: hypothetical protein LUH57_05995 [Ruminococcus sp.]|nr:hypothetical protein [Ruminococcus sp.]